MEETLEDGWSVVRACSTVVVSRAERAVCMGSEAHLRIRISRFIDVVFGQMPGLRTALEGPSTKMDF